MSSPKFAFKHGVRSNLHVKLNRPGVTPKSFKTNEQVRAAIKALPTAVIKEIGTEALIPEELIENLGVDTTTGAAGFARGNLSNKASRLINRQMELIAAVHREYYISWLRGVGDFLDDPGIDPSADWEDSLSPTVEREPVFRFKTERAGPGRVIHSPGRLTPNLSFSFHTRFARLAPDSAVIASGGTPKSHLPDPKAHSYWKHTGRLSRAYTSGMRNQIRNLKTADFISKSSLKISRVGEQRFKTHSAGPTSRAKFARSVNIRFSVGIPSWRGHPYMDTILIKPFAGASPGGVGAYFVTDNFRSRYSREFKKLKAHYLQLLSSTGNYRDRRHLEFAAERKAREELKEWVKTSGIRHMRKFSNASGLRRVLNPEFRRPVLREASVHAGRIMREGIRRIPQQLDRLSNIK